MKKILLAFDGQHFSESAFDFAYHLHTMQPALLTGAFLSHKDYTTVWQYGVPGGAAVLPTWGLEDEDEKVAEKNIHHFETLCQNNGIDFRVHNDLGAYALYEISKESRFADLMIIGSELFYENIGRIQPNDYMKYALRDTECPVILVPEEKFKFPDNIVLAYDGSESSVYAIKQFTYLFPEWCKKRTILVYVGEGNEIPSQIYIEELAARHFSNLTLFKMDVSPRNHFITWLADQKNPLLVTGAFGRGGLNEFFRKSFITDIIRDYKTPVFIAHK
ncbi:universal stress protein [Solitalea lacus]|uniref:universal stress protein n=1 Tax=Solitalea lacus TaxID=2911172 RepID=UPI001ED9EF4D|nr:universal stress protein [Solitalea lacus]UKJ06713.1 universal stress protein [Solitalea lacus]